MENTNLRKFAAFAVTMRQIRDDFPDFANEIDRCLYDVGRLIGECDDPNCSCMMDFKTFHSEMQIQSLSR